MSQQQWDAEKIRQLYELPFLELVHKAHSVHREHFPKPEMELCTLLNIKTGGCPENCAYCPQSAHFDTGLQREKLWDKQDILTKAKLAKENGTLRFCMGAAWRSPPKKELPKVVEIIKAVKDMGLETCVTLGMLDEEDAKLLSDAGLDYYNHNLDSSPEFYEKIISTRTYQDRLDTLHHVHNAGINVCCGGILGMGETRDDRIGLLLQLTKLPAAPNSIPINKLIPVDGTPLEKTDAVDNFEIIRTIAVTRIMNPTSMVRLSAGRENMSDETQTLCFMAGANSIHYGEKLLTTKNPVPDRDMALLNKLQLKPRTNQAAESCA